MSLRMRLKEANAHLDSAQSALFEFICANLKSEASGMLLSQVSPYPLLRSSNTIIMTPSMIISPWSGLISTLL